MQDISSGYVISSVVQNILRVEATLRFQFQSLSARATLQVNHCIRQQHYWYWSRYWRKYYIRRRKRSLKRREPGQRPNRKKQAKSEKWASVNGQQATEARFFVLIYPIFAGRYQSVNRIQYQHSFTPDPWMAVEWKTSVIKYSRIIPVQNNNPFLVQILVIPTPCDRKILEKSYMKSIDYAIPPSIRVRFAAILPCGRVQFITAAIALWDKSTRS
jgi:hypothetical protein